MKTIADGERRRTSTCEEAKRRLLSVRGEPLFFSDWLRPLFIHYEVDPEVLKREVPFTLDLRDGKAYVSLVAFTMARLRPVMGGKLTELAFLPIATHGLLNVRTYVRHGEEPGIYFLSEWIPNRLSVVLGPRTFGLPYRLGNLCYEHHHEQGCIDGCVSANETNLRYTAAIDPTAQFETCNHGSLDEFLVERYTAYTCIEGKRRFFRIWHPPWKLMRVNAEVMEDKLLVNRWKWFENARLVAGNYSPGANDVWMGRPHLVGECGV